MRLRGKPTKNGLPVTGRLVRWLTDTDLRAHGAPVIFRPRLLVATEVFPMIDSTIPAVSIPSAGFPRAGTPIDPEHVVVILLRLHPVAARYFVRTHVEDIDFGRLLGMVIRAELERPAHGVGLRDWMTELPAADPRPLPRSALRRLDREDYGEVTA